MPHSSLLLLHLQISTPRPRPGRLQLATRRSYTVEPLRQGTASTRCRTEYDTHVSSGERDCQQGSGRKEPKRTVIMEPTLREGAGRVQYR